LNPKYIIDEIDKFYYKNKKIKFQSVEGYIRQLIWREYVMYVYLFYHKDLIKGNYYNNKKKLDDSWYNGTTGIIFIDDLIKKATNNAYLHHIERLMYIGNFMLISKINPKDAFNWFMNFFIDAVAPWVMEPNVYGMSQQSCGNLMMNRPYICSSNYISKMSNYKKKYDIYPKIKNFEWFEIMDSLYYNFINDNKTKLSNNYSVAFIVSLWNKKSIKEKKQILKIAKEYLEY
jgi:deoxyribodipyrimidine photolyase-related protein